MQLFTYTNPVAATKFYLVYNLRKSKAYVVTFKVRTHGGINTTVEAGVGPIPNFLVSRKNITLTAVATEHVFAFIAPTDTLSTLSFIISSENGVAFELVDAAVVYDVAEITAVRPLFMRCRVRTTLTPVPLALFTGDKRMPIPNDFESYGGLTIKQDRPLPLTILMVVRKAKVY